MNSTTLPHRRTGLRRRRSGAGRRAGHTLVEVSLTLGLFAGSLAVFSSSLSSSVADAKNLETRAEARRRLDVGSERVRRILDGSIAVAGYPQLTDAAALAAAHPDIAAVAGGVLTDGDRSNALLFREPADADGDGWPDVAPDGTLIVRPEPAALALVEGQSGKRFLVHVDASRRARILARNIADVRFTDSAASGFTLPLDGLQVALMVDRLGGATVDAGGASYASEFLVRFDQ